MLRLSSVWSPDLGSRKRLHDPHEIDPLLPFHNSAETKPPGTTGAPTMKDADECDTFVVASSRDSPRWGQSIAFPRSFNPGSLGVASTSLRAGRG